MSEWASYPDRTLRETYPPAPSRGGHPNAEAKEAVIATVASQHQRTVQQEAEFRARQYQRRLQTRGAQAMREPVSLSQPVVVPLPDDPALDEYKAAGWV